MPHLVPRITSIVPNYCNQSERPTGPYNADLSSPVNRSGVIFVCVCSVCLTVPMTAALIYSIRLGQSALRCVRSVCVLCSANVGSGRSSVSVYVCEPIRERLISCPPLTYTHTNCAPRSSGAHNVVVATTAAPVTHANHPSITWHFRRKYVYVCICALIM